MAGPLSTLTDKFLLRRMFQERLWIRYQVAPRRLIVLDYDGTLTPIVKNPAEALPSKRLIAVLTTLSDNPRNAVWIISGRDQEFLQTHLGTIPGLGLCAEHGAFKRWPNSTQWDNITDYIHLSWRDEAIGVFRHYTANYEGSNTEVKQVCVVWHYRNCNQNQVSGALNELRVKLRALCQKYALIEFIEGKANFEVRPKAVNKGFIVRELIANFDRARGIPQPASAAGGSSAGIIPGYDGTEFILCAGDDYTDEAMFIALRDASLPYETAFSCYVGPEGSQTAASWIFPGYEGVISTLQSISTADVDGELDLDGTPYHSSYSSYVP